MFFCEKVYFYDDYLKFEKLDEKFDINNLLPIVDEMDNVSKKIEKEMEEYYFMKPSDIDKIEVSNFMMFLDFKEPLESILNTKIYSALTNLAKASEIIIPNIENKINFNFRLEIYPKIIEDGLLNINPNDIIVKERILTFSRDLTKPKKNQYAVRMRGLPIRECFNFLKILETLVD